MGETTAETVKEIERTRERLGDEVHELQQRLPSPAAVAKRAAIIAGSVVGGTVTLIALRRGIRKRRARPVYPVPVQRVLDSVPAGWQDTVTDPKTMAYGVGAALVLLRLVEIRRLGTIRRAIAARM